VANSPPFLGAAVLLVAIVANLERTTPKDLRNPQPAQAPRDGREVRVLFLGNSLTRKNDLPSLVEAMAAAGGVKLKAVAITPDGGSLEDHWQNERARQVLASTLWDHVVLQQGPSSRPESQIHLRKWSAQWADEARQHGVKPALYMVWPFQGQKNGFEQVSKSYRSAAKASNATILPAGDAWQEALRRDPNMPLYQSDRLHPTRAGTYLAALVITYELTGVKPTSVPARLKLASENEFALPDAQADTLRQAAEKVHAER